jgi:N-acetylmuramoyl-L-alanine amidase
MKHFVHQARSRASCVLRTSSIQRMRPDIAATAHVARHTAVPLRMRAGAALMAMLLGCGSSAILCGPRASAAGNLSGMTVVLDPGHNGVADSSISRQVPNGRGGTKACNTSGTSTNDGYPEHSFTWDVTQHIRDALEQQGIRTTMTRDSDNGVGPCVDQRADLANAAKPDAIISIHADGGPPSGHGFHVNYSSPPVTDVQAGPSVQLATTMRDALVASGLTESNYIGSQGMYGRADLAGLNFAQYPAILIELGNMKNAVDAAQIESPDGRAKYAKAVTDGITTYLSNKGATR